MISQSAPRNIEYDHDNRWHDDNGHSHVSASLVRPSLTIPFKDNVLLLGMWQQIVVLEMDTKPRKRRIVIQILGE